LSKENQQNLNSGLSWDLPSLVKLSGNQGSLKKITLRQAGEIVSEVSGMSINYRTINSIENAQGIPQFNTLAAIAASRIVTCDRGVPLSIYDFIAEDIIEFCGITINPAHDEQDCSMGH
jgi:hypothetical protein